MASRVLLESNSLWVKVLKGLYFPTSDFLQVAEGSRSSWAWASMLAGQRLITEEAVWSIGDEKTIRTFMDAWIPERYEEKLGNHPV